MLRAFLAVCSKERKGNWGEEERRGRGEEGRGEEERRVVQIITVI